MFAARAYVCFVAERQSSCMWHVGDTSKAKMAYFSFQCIAAATAARLNCLFYMQILGYIYICMYVCMYILAYICMCIDSFLLSLFAYLSARSFWVFAARGSVKKSLQSEFFGVAQNWLHCVAAAAFSNVIVMRWCCYCCCLRYIFVTAVSGRHELKYCGIPITRTHIRIETTTIITNIYKICMSISFYKMKFLFRCLRSRLGAFVP